MITGKGDKKANINQLHTNDWATHEVPGMNSGVPEEWAVPTELVVPFMLCKTTRTSEIEIALDIQKPHETLVSVACLLAEIL
jgi:hypothetical protein